MSRRSRREDEDGPSKQYNYVHRSARAAGANTRRIKDNDWWRPGPPTDSSSPSVPTMNTESTHSGHDYHHHTDTVSASSARVASPQRYKRTHMTDIIQETVEKLVITKTDTAASQMHFEDPNEVSRLFGQLPDPIRLHEQTGEFDGQVTFIGHPNRDISAHQWSALEFQWQIIGRYIHAREKVEGMLASDRPKDFEGSVDSIDFFKHAAKCREESVVSHRRLAASADSSTQEQLDTSSRSDSLLGTKRTPDADSSSLNASARSAITERESDCRLPKWHSDLTGLGYYDDPFTSAEAPVSPKMLKYDRAQMGPFHNKGSLDLQYSFPTRGTNASALKYPGLLRVSPSKMSGVSEQPSTNGPFQAFDPIAIQNLLFGDNLHNIARDQSIFKNNTLHSSELFTPQNPGDVIGGFQQLVSDANEQSKIIGTNQNRTTYPKFAETQPTARSLFPQPGRTVANPFQLITSARRNTANTDKDADQGIGVIGSSRLTTHTGDTNPAAALRFSDPDGSKRAATYEIVNGLSQQPPTMQNFKGPFFTDSKPSSDDPTAALSSHISEEERLVSWYRDGQRPTRQKDYARTLIATAASNTKDSDFGAIGEAHRPAKHSQFENTAPFVRVYETLSEYVDEYQNGSGGSYFTRAWKPAKPKFRDLTPQGNNSYLAKSVASSTSLEQRSINRTLRSTISPEMHGSHLPLLQTLPRQAHGAVGDKPGGLMAFSSNRVGVYPGETRWR